MKLKKILMGLLVGILLAVWPVQIIRADEEINTGQAAETEVGILEQEKTEEQIAEEEKAKLEAEKKASLEVPADTNSLKNWPEGPAVYAHSAVVMDMDSGVILYAKKPDERHYPASITKLLTVLIALENGTLTDTVTFSQESVDILNWDDANIGMRPGEEISMRDALYAVLLASANEVSYAVAESIGYNYLNGGYDTFIQRMNDRAKELGCTGSNWVNPNGLHDEDHYTTAHDMALIASAVYQEETFREIMKILEYRIPATNLEAEERVFQQNHKMLWDENYYYYEYCTGGKTGYTDQAMTTLVTMADNGEMRLAAVVLYDYGVDAYTDTRAIMDYVFNNFEKVPVLDLEKPEEINSFLDEESYVVLPKGMDVLEVDCTVNAENGMDGRAVYTYQGQTVGSADVTLNEEELVEKNDTETTDENGEGAKSGDTDAVEKKSSQKAMTVITVGVAALLLLICFGVYRSFKKWREKRRRMRRRNK